LPLLQKNNEVNMESKLSVFTLKAETQLTFSDEVLLEDLMSLLEAYGLEVVGELSYEEISQEADNG